MSSLRPVPCLREEVGVAAASRAPVSLRARLSRSRLEPADAELVINVVAIYRTVGFATGNTAEIALAGCSFPAELLELRLGPLLRLILFVGSIKEQDRLRGNSSISGPQTFRRDGDRSCRSDSVGRLVAALGGGSTTYAPAGNHQSDRSQLQRDLRQFLPPPVSFFRATVGFLHEAFERFVIEDWKGLIRGQHRYFSAAVRRNSHWVTVNEAER